MKKRYKIPLISLGSLIGIFFVFVLIRIPYFFREKKTQEQVVKIHNTKLTIDDVIGNNLPPDPGEEADKTIQGIDANKNGIRDDVELAIFKAYPNSAKTRAVLLQYALALQMEVVQEVVNGETVGAVAEKGDNAFFCISKIVPENNKWEGLMHIDKHKATVDKYQINTEERKKYQKNFYQHMSSGNVGDSSCDVDLELLEN